MTNRMDSAAALTPRRRKSQLHWQLLLMVLPALIYLLIFHYKPMYGVVIAFKNYKFKLGILGSPWCGLENFQRLFSSYWFPIILKNTLTISILSLVMGFPMPILLALMVNEIEHEKIKRTFQTISYAPHFISTIVVCGMVILFTNPNSGIINKVAGALRAGARRLHGRARPPFKWIYVLSGVWQAAWAGAPSYSLCGARPAWTNPCWRPPTSTARTAHPEDLLRQPARARPHDRHRAVHPAVRFPAERRRYEKVYLPCRTPPIMTASEVISTYAYKVGLEQADFAFSTATLVVLNSAVNCDHTGASPIRRLAPREPIPALW